MNAPYESADELNVDHHGARPEEAKRGVVEDGDPSPLSPRHPALGRDRGKLPWSAGYTEVVSTEHGELIEGVTALGGVRDDTMVDQSNRLTV